MHLLLRLLEITRQPAAVATPSAAGGQLKPDPLLRSALGLSWLTVVMGAVCGGTVEGLVDYIADWLFPYVGGLPFAVLWAATGVLGPEVTPAVTLCNGPERKLFPSHLVQTC